MKAKNHPQQVDRLGADDLTDDRATTLEDFRPWAERFGGFTLDAAASAANTKCEKFYDRAADGLSQSWAGERVWCNPPFSSIARWVGKAWAEAPGCELIVMLLPANRTEQGWWMDMVEPYRDRPGSPLRTEFLRGRLRFLKPAASSVVGDRPPFGCVLLIWQRTGPTPPNVLDLGPAS